MNKYPKLRLDYLDFVCTDVDEYLGFFIIEFGNGGYLQCELVHEEYSMFEYVYENPDYSRIIDPKNCGFDHGICGEENAWALGVFGKEHVLDFILKHARKSDIKVL